MKLKIVSRDSTLAKVQVDELMKNIDVDWELKSLLSYGDKNKDISLLNNPDPDFFTREIDEAIMNGDADVSIHSAKDLPWPIDPSLEIIALTKPFDQSDSLVSKNNLTLNQLPKGARIGTSSKDRKRQLLKAREDLEIVSIRGTIEERIEQVDNGFVDGLIVATCALTRLGLEGRIAETLNFETAPLQGMLAVISKKNRLKYKKLFSKVDNRVNYGSVTLVGFGPGDPELLTVKGFNYLNKADIIFYDALIPKSYLNNFNCRKEYVGKRKKYHSSTQDEISEKIYQAAKSGLNVVRLKGGDPFIFGRGGEEADYLSSRLVDVNIVPGITAGQGASSSISIPLTKRGISRSLTLSTAHNGSIEPTGIGTELVYMGGTKLSEVQSSLINKGYNNSTPVLLVENATTTKEFVIKTSVENLHLEKPILPVIVIAGDVAEEYQSERVILNCGLTSGNYGLSGKIYHQPLIDVTKIDFEVDIEKYDGVIFTSKNAVEYFCQDNDISNLKIYSIGGKTNDAIRLLGYVPYFTSSKPDSDTFSKELKSLTYGKLIYPSSSLSNNSLHKLKNVDVEVQYKTTLKDVKKIDLDRIGGIIFTSPSTVDSFIQNYGSIPSVDIFCFGKFTKKRILSYREDLYVQTIQT